MKQLFFTLLFLALTFSSQAQIAKRSHSRIKVNGTVLSEQEKTRLLSDINGIDYNEAWKRAASGRKVGTGLTIGGAIATGVGLITFAGGIVITSIGAVVGGTAGAIAGQAQEGAQQGAQAGAPYITAGAIVGGAGVIALGTGIPLLIVNNKKMNRILDQYNSTQAVQVTFGPTASGIGLCMSF